MKKMNTAQTLELQNKVKMVILLRKLSSTDYQSIRDTSKFVRGLLSESEKLEYFTREDERQAIREKIRELEKESI